MLSCTNSFLNNQYYVDSQMNWVDNGLCAAIIIQRYVLGSKLCSCRLHWFVAYWSETVNFGKCYLNSNWFEVSTTGWAGPS